MWFTASREIISYVITFRIHFFFERVDTASRPQVDPTSRALYRQGGGGGWFEATAFV